MKYDVGIIGSGPAGLSAAIYAKRANLSAVVIEKEYEGTGQIAESGQVDNYPGFPGISGYDLGENFREHAVKLGVSFMEQEVTEIKKEASSDFELVFADGSQVEAKTVIYAAGATPRRANIPGEQEYAGKGVSYCAICDGSFYRGKSVAVLGGGDTALDDAVYLADVAEKVCDPQEKGIRYLRTGASGKRDHRRAESNRSSSGRCSCDRCERCICCLRSSTTDRSSEKICSTG